VVCDGAGTARYGLEGAQLTSDLFGAALLGLVDQLTYRAPGHWINDEIIQCALDVRSALRKKAQSDDLRDFHTTIVAALIGPTGGFLIHVGDGAAFGARFTDDAGKCFIDDGYVISEPENGEYSNETFFITEGDWVKHLRITPLPSLDWLMLASDGGCSLALDSNNRIRTDFFMPFLFASQQADDVRSEKVQELLETPINRALTNDDITIVAIFSNRTKIEKSNVYALRGLDLEPSENSGAQRRILPLSSSDPEEVTERRTLGWVSSLVSRVIRRR
jgi:hypothetical protein